MKARIAGTAALLLAAVLFFRMPVQAVSADAAIVMDPVGRRVLFEKQADTRSLVASTTKIMTGLLVCENCNPLEAVRIPAEAVGVEGSSMYLQAGEVLTVQELLYGMMLASGNDAAVALAIACADSVEQFVQMMNDRAESLGMQGTHFENPNGLDGRQHYSTARDLALLSVEAMKNPIFRQTVSTKQVQVGSRWLKNHNKLLWRCPGADGIKTGYTRAAGRILVSSAVRKGRRLVAVTIQDPDDWNDHMELLAHGFSEYEEKTMIEAGNQVGLLPVSGGNRKAVPLIAAAPFRFFCTQGEKAAVLLPGPGFAYAPVVRGAAAGEGLVLIAGTAVGRIPLIYGETVELSREKKENFWNRIFGGTS